MEISDKVLKFLQDEESQELLNNNKFEKLYEKFYEEVEHDVPPLSSSMTSEFTQLLYAAGIDPLEHMDIIPKYFLCRNNSLKEFTIPSHIKSIGEKAFYNCTGLTSITIPDSTMEIGNSAFSGCEKLISVHIGSGVKELSPELFRVCSSLKQVTIGDNVESIGYSAFNECSALTNIDLKNVKVIGDLAFIYCNNLETVLLSKNAKLEYVGEGAFWDSSKFEGIRFRGTMEEWRDLHVRYKENDGYSFNVLCTDGVLRSKSRGGGGWIKVK